MVNSLVIRDVGAGVFFNIRLLLKLISIFNIFGIPIQAVIQSVFWILGGLIFIFSGLSIAVVFRSYFLETPLLSDVISGIGLIIAFLGLIMVGYGYRFIRNAKL
jgi:hypothetical protein